MFAEAPVLDGLIVDVGVRLGQECHEAILEPQFQSRSTGVLGTTGAPKIQLDACAVQLANCGNHCRHWNSLRTDRADERVIDINKDDSWVHSCGLRIDRVRADTANDSALSEGCWLDAHCSDDQSELKSLGSLLCRTTVMESVFRRTSIFRAHSRWETSKAICGIKTRGRDR
jgi:hypothetical protein